MITRKLWVVGGIMLFGSAGVVVWAGERGAKEGHEEREQQVAMAQVPAKARTALTKLAGENKILGVLKENEEGAVAYKGVWRAGTLAHSATVSVEGALMATQDAVEGEEVPAAVRRSAAKLVPGAQKVTFEKSTTITYRVIGVTNGRKRGVEVSAAGTKDENEGGTRDEGEEKRR